jgi:hypothetical protein
LTQILEATEAKFSEKIRNAVNKFDEIKQAGLDGMKHGNKQQIADDKEKEIKEHEKTVAQRIKQEEEAGRAEMASKQILLYRNFYVPTISENIFLVVCQMPTKEFPVGKEASIIFGILYIFVGISGYEIK